VHVRAIRGHMIGEDDRAERSIVDHMHIIEALEARDGELAECLVRKHALDLADDVDRTPAPWTEPPGPGHNPGAGARKERRST
jgi:DNA-binding GntR family transcriptional regulator